MPAPRDGAIERLAAQFVRDRVRGIVGHFLHQVSVDEMDAVARRDAPEAAIASYCSTVIRYSRDGIQAGIAGGGGIVDVVADMGSSLSFRFRRR